MFPDKRVERRTRFEVADFENVGDLDGKERNDHNLEALLDTQRISERQSFTYVSGCNNTELATSKLARGVCEKWPGTLAHFSPRKS